MKPKTEPRSSGRPRKLQSPEEQKIFRRLVALKIKRQDICDVFEISVRSYQRYVEELCPPNPLAPNLGETSNNKSKLSCPGQQGDVDPRQT